MDRYAVFGNPVAHSKSPAIHQAFASETGQTLTYTAVCVALESFEQEVEQFFAQGGKGLNITVPFKEQAWALADTRTHRAEKAGAANTLYLNAQQQLCADNTDGVGMVRDMLNNHGLTITGQRVLVLGAGGAVRGVLGPLLEQQPAELVLANRTLSKAEWLAELFAGEVPVRASGFEQLNEPFDLIINGTSASLQGELPPLSEALLTLHTWCYDMMYSAQATSFQSWARACGAAGQLDGLGMLVEQAAEAFYMWRGVRPATRPVIDQIRKNIVII